jgi:hypothetical protein
MKTIRAHRDVLRVSILLVVSSFLIGFSLINPMQDENSIYFPFLNYLDPVAEELKNHLVISEVMFNPTGAEPGNEWIEIFNRSPLRVDLHEYKIGDSETPGDLEGMYAFPEGSHVSPGKTVVIANQAAPFIGTYGFRPDFELVDSDPNVQNLLKYRSWSGGAINLNNSGDEITIINKEDKQVDAVSWGDSQFAFDPPAPITDDGMTLERIPANTDSNRASDWSISAEPDPGTVNVITNTPVPISPTDTQPYCDNIPVLISEVLYDPAVSGEPEGEWVEIYNYGDIRVSLDCLILGDEETGGGSEGMMAFPTGGSINPRQVIVIANHADDFNNNYGFFPDFEIQQANESVPNLSPFPQWASGSISLSNSGDEVLLINLSGIQIDAVSWGGSVFAFNPPVSGVNPGHSISRQPADYDSNSKYDWVDLSHPQPGYVVLNPPPNSPTPETAAPSPEAPSSTPTRTPTRTPTPTLTNTPQPTIDIVINEILADPHSEAGDANNDGDVNSSDDEFIEIINNSVLPLDISEWSIGDVLEIRHTFQIGTILDPGCGLVLFGGGNPNGDFGIGLVQVASSGKLGLNNSMETIFVYDSQLDIVTSLSYGEEAGDDQSITRDPDIVGNPPLRKHSLASGSNGAIFSPGTMINGSIFSGCVD